MPPPLRDVRRAQGPDRPSVGDRRSPFQRDRDRILYSDHFRRLSGVTQVASSADGGVFHNRLTHSLKVAQVARRLAEFLLAEHASEVPEMIACLDPDVVEAAALAHDLGHPPFGHVADERLCELAERHQLEDGYEGNAQTFRIVTRLSVRRGPRDAGLDLTRATLAAVAKYPWRRERGASPDQKRRRKFSFFDDDGEAARFAMDGTPQNEKTLECQVMDLADAITYSVHDLEDFYRAGLIPVERLVRSENYRRNFLGRWKEHRPDDRHQQKAQDVHSWPLVEGLLKHSLAEESEPGTRSEAVLLDSFRSVAISRFVQAVQLKKLDGVSFSLELPATETFQINFLQRLVWDYVILSPRLATQQTGQLRIIEGLFDYFLESLRQDRRDRLPTRFRADAEVLGLDRAKSPLGARLAIDIVATLTEAEAKSLYERISGYDGGSVLDMIN